MTEDERMRDHWVKAEEVITQLRNHYNEEFQDVCMVLLVCLVKVAKITGAERSKLMAFIVERLEAAYDEGLEVEPVPPKPKPDHLKVIK